MPWVTLGINVAGSLILGIVVGWLDDRRPLARAFLGTGMLGGFTTYSAFAVATALWVTTPWLAAGLAAASVIAGVAGALAGLVRRTPDRGPAGRRRTPRGRRVSPWLLLVALAGGVGAGLRYVVDRLLTPTRGGRFPRGILVVNVSGSFALGVITGLGAAIAPELSLVLGLGLLGGYTTFSTVSVETVLLAQRRRWRDAALNLFGTLVLAVLAAALGLLLGGWLAAA